MYAIAKNVTEKDAPLEPLDIYPTTQEALINKIHWLGRAYEIWAVVMVESRGLVIMRIGSGGEAFLGERGGRVAVVGGSDEKKRVAELLCDDIDRGFGKEW